METKLRIVAIEEHISTDWYIDQTKDLQIGAGEEAERSVMNIFDTDPDLRKRIVDLDVRLKAMDESGMDVAVLSLNPPGVQYFTDGDKATWLARQFNDQLAEIVERHPDRFAGMAVIAPQQPDKAARELKRAVRDLGFRGTMINSHTLGHYLDEPRFEPILAAAEHEGVPIYLHPRVPSPAMLQPFTRYGMLGALWGYQAEAGTHAIRMILSGVFDRHPELKIVLGHLGEGLPFWLWRLDDIYHNTLGWGADKLNMVRLQKKPTDYLHTNFMVTTSGMDDPDALMFLIKRLGVENIMFAIDFPYEDSGKATKFLRDAPLTGAQRALIAHANADRLYGLTV